MAGLEPMVGSALFLTKLMVAHLLQPEYERLVSHLDDNSLKPGDEVRKICLNVC